MKRATLNRSSMNRFMYSHPRTSTDPVHVHVPSTSSVRAGPRLDAIFPCRICLYLCLLLRSLHSFSIGPQPHPIPSHV